MEGPSAEQLYAQGDLYKAKEASEKELQTKPDDLSLKFQLLRCLVDLFLFDEAISFQATQNDLLPQNILPKFLLYKGTQHDSSLSLSLGFLLL